MAPRRHQQNQCRTRQIQDREHQKYGRRAEYGRDAFGEETADEAADRTDCGNAAKVLFRRTRIEPLGGDQPESRSQHRTEARDVKVHERGHYGRRGGGNETLQDEESGADDERR